MYSLLRLYWTGVVALDKHRNSKFGLRSSGFGNRSSETGKRSAKNGKRKTERGKRKTELGVPVGFRRHFKVSGRGSSGNPDVDMACLLLGRKEFEFLIAVLAATLLLLVAKGE